MTPAGFDLIALEDAEAKKRAVVARPRPLAGGQDYEVKYEAKKTRRSSAAVKKVRNSRSV